MMMRSGMSDLCSFYFSFSFSRFVAGCHYVYMALWNVVLWVFNGH